LILQGKLLFPFRSGFFTGNVSVFLVLQRRLPQISFSGKRTIFSCIFNKKCLYFSVKKLLFFPKSYAIIQPDGAVSICIMACHEIYI